MADQRRHAGNLGDVVKHAIWVDVARAWQARQPGARWVETHAGFHHYTAASLGADAWDAGRAPTLGPLSDALAAGTDLGVLGAVLAGWLPHRRYPGSLVAVAEAAPGLALRGFDLGADQVASFVGDDRMEVTRGDGFAGVAGADVVVCDPFWDDAQTWSQVADLSNRVDALLVWFPGRADLAPAAWQALGLDGVQVCWPQARSGLVSTGVAWRLPPEVAAQAQAGLGRLAAVLGLVVVPWLA